MVDEVIHGDCIKEMQSMEEHSIDSIVTDSPYGLTFLNRNWDKFSSMGFLRFSYKWSKEALRIQKPGAYLVNCSAPKKYHLMACGVELAGFNIKDCIFWCYGSGWSKNLDISKAIDSLLGHEREIIGKRYRHGGGKDTQYMGMTQDPEVIITKPSSKEAQQWDGWGTGLTPAHEDIILAQKPYERTYANNILKWGVGALNIDGCRIGYNPQKETDSRIYDQSKNITRGTHKNATLKYAPDGNDYPMYNSQKGRWPSNLILFHHPDCKLIGTKDVGSGHPKHNQEIKRKGMRPNSASFNSQNSGFDVNKGQSLGNYGVETINAYECHPECPIRMIDQQSGFTKTRPDLNYKWNKTNCDGNTFKNRGTYIPRDDKGGASRFFYNAKAYVKERNAGCEGLFWEIRGDKFIQISKDVYQSLPEKNRAEGNPISTLKPINLMRYLVRLVTPPGGTVLDPFGGCYDDKTEILTNKGWKLFQDLTIEDKVASLKKGTKELIYINPLEIQKYKYNGKMIKVKHRSIDLLITPDHNMYFRGHHRQNYEFMKANLLKYETLYSINSIKWKGIEKEYFYPPKINYNKYSSKYNQKERLKMDDFLEFLGWYISDGHVNISKYTIAITQTKEDNWKEIGDCITRLGYKWNFVQNRRFKFGNKQLYNYLRVLGKAHQKHIPYEFLNLSKRQLTILFNALIKGDGHIERDGRTRYYTTSKILAGQMQELAIKLGYNSTLKKYWRKKAFSKKYNRFIKGKHTSYIISIRKSKECKLLRSKHFKEEYYNGYVYCCTVPSHILYVRRNGKPIWCGNSGTTAIACLIEGFNYIIIEKRKVFAKTIIPKRLTYWKDPAHWKLLKDHTLLPQIKTIQNKRQNLSIMDFLEVSKQNV
jgi:DNA modification methylase